MRTHIELDPDRLLHNLALFRRIAKKRIMFVVKGNAYGHGLREIAQICQKRPEIDSFAVDSLNEALVLRAVDKKKPVLVIGWTDEQELRELIALGVETVVPSRAHLRWVERIASRLRVPARVHLKVETGTNRMGMEAEEAVAILNDWHSPYVAVKGLYSHFANIEDTSDPAYARGQLAAFRSVLAQVRRKGLLRHFSCSAAALLFPETHFDVIRVGISAYGYWPSKQTYVSYLEKNGDRHLELRPVLSWQAKVAQVKKVKKGTPVGYGLTYKTLTPARLAVIPVGYYDGYDRRLSNVSSVIIHGSKAPLRGRVCMNMFMVEVTHIPRVAVGDRVLLIGEEQGERVDAEMLAELCGTIHYEFLARINPLLPRVIAEKAEQAG